jgi:hypothetical protein
MVLKKPEKPRNGAKDKLFCIPHIDDYNKICYTKNTRDIERF